MTGKVLNIARKIEDMKDERSSSRGSTSACRQALHDLHDQSHDRVALPRRIKWLRTTSSFSIGWARDAGKFQAIANILDTISVVKMTSPAEIRALPADWRVFPHCPFSSPMTNSLKSYANFNTLTVTGRIFASKVSKNGDEWFAVTLISNLADDDGGVTFTFNTKTMFGLSMPTSFRLVVRSRLSVTSSPLPRLGSTRSPAAASC